MLSFRSLLCSGLVAATLAIAPRAHAQLTESAGIFAGYYRPYGHFDPASIGIVGLPNAPSDMKGSAWGGTLHLGVGRRFGVAAQLATAHSVLPEEETPEGPHGPTNVSVVLGSVVGQYDVSLDTRRYQLWLNAGPSLVQHGGDAYHLFGSPTSFGSALGATLDIPLAAHLQLSANATGLFYMFDVPMPAADRLNPGSLEHGAQRDVLLHIGIDWTS